MFTIGTAHDISFKVNVMGTSVPPTVRVVLDTVPALTFPARQTDAGWAATITIPTGIEPCTCALKVEVVVNNRLFTPLTKEVSIDPMDASVPYVEPPAEDQPDAAPPVEAAPESEPDTIEFTATLPETDPSQPAPEVPRISLIQMVAREDRQQAAQIPVPPLPPLQALQQVVEAPAPRHFAPISSGLPAPSTVKATPIKVNLSDIAKVAESIEPPKPKRVTRTKPVAETKHDTPVRLIKGDIIYE